MQLEAGVRLTCILHEGGHEHRASWRQSRRIVLFQTMSLPERFVLVGFLENLPLHLGPSRSSHGSRQQYYRGTSQQSKNADAVPMHGSSLRGHPPTGSDA